MKIDIPFEIGDRIIVDGKIKIVKGIHVFICKNGTVKKYRFHIGDGEFVTINAEDVQYEQV